MSDQTYRQSSRDGEHGRETGLTAHSRAQSGVSHITSFMSGEPSVELAPLAATRDDGTPLSPSNRSLDTPLSVQPPNEVSMRRGIRRYMENGGGRGTVAPRARIAVRTLSGSLHHTPDAANWSMSSPGAAGSSTTSLLVDGNPVSVPSPHQPVQVAPYWQNTQQYVPRTWMQYAVSPAQPILRVGTPNSHSCVGAEVSGTSCAGGGGGSCAVASDTSAVFAQAFSDSAAPSPSNMGVSAHRRAFSLLEPPAQLALVPPYDSMALSPNATIGDYIMGHSPVGNVDAEGGTSNFDAEANDAIKQYSDAIRRLHQSPNESQMARSATFRPLPSSFGAAPRNSPCQLHIPGDVSETLLTDDVFNSSAARLVSPPDATADALLSQCATSDEADPQRVPDSLAHTQRPARHSQLSQPPSPACPTASTTQQFQRVHQRRRSSLHLYTTVPKGRGNCGAGGVGNSVFTLSQSQPSLGIPAISLPDPFIASPSGNVVLLGSHGTPSGAPVNRATFPWDLPSPPAAAGNGLSLSGMNGYYGAATATAGFGRATLPGSPNSLWMRNAESGLAATGQPYARGGFSSARHSLQGSTERGVSHGGGGGGAGMSWGADPRHHPLTPGSVENHPLHIHTTCYDEMTDLLDVCRLLNSDVENVYGVVPATQHHVQKILVTALTSLTAYLQTFYKTFCVLPASSTRNGQGLSLNGSHGTIHAVCPTHASENSIGLPASPVAAESQGGAVSGPRHTRGPSSSTHVSTIASAEAQEAAIELAQHLIFDLEIDLLPPLTSFHTVETSMQESRRRKELVAFWAIEVTSAMTRQLNSALMGTAARATAPEDRTDSVPLTSVQGNADTSADASALFKEAEFTRAGRPNAPAATRANDACDAATLADIDKLVAWLGDAEPLRREIEERFPKLLQKYLTLAVEKSVLDIATDYAMNTHSDPATGTVNHTAQRTKFPTALANLVKTVLDPNTGVKADVDMDVCARALPSIEEIMDEFSDLSQAAAWSWWYSQQELCLAAPRSQAQYQRDRTAVVRRFCEQNLDAQQLMKAVATNAVWAEQAREQQQLTTAQLEDALEEIKAGSENVLRLILRYTIVRYVAQQPGVRDARSPAEALASQLYRHLASLHATLSELTSSSTEMGQEASLIGMFVHAASKGVRAYGAGLTRVPRDARTGDSSTDFVTVVTGGEETPNTRDTHHSDAQEHAAVDAFLIAFASEMPSSPHAALSLPMSKGSGAPAAPLPSDALRRQHPLLIADSHTLPPHLVSFTSRCTFVKTVHTAVVCAAQQICALLQSSHYAVLREEPTHKLQSATAGVTLPIFNMNGAERASRRGSAAPGAVESSGHSCLTWEAPRPSGRALARLQQSLCDLYVSLDRNRRVLQQTTTLK